MTMWARAVRCLVSFVLLATGAVPLTAGGTARVATAAPLDLSTTTANGAIFTYDGPAVARVDVYRITASEASPAQLSDARDVPALPSAEARRASTTSPDSFIATNTAGGVDTGLVHGPPLGRPNFIASSNGEIVAVPEGAVGPTVAESGNGIQFTGGSGGRGLDPRVTDVRVMDPVTTGKYPIPGGYVSYSNGAGQTVSPVTGQTIGKSDPFWHWQWGPT
jgi:hypothetical protein